MGAPCLERGAAPAPALRIGDSPSQTSKTHRPHVQACQNLLFVRGNLFSHSIHWLKGSDLVFSAVKQWLPQWDENREMQKSLGGFGEPGMGGQGLCWGQRSWWSLGQQQRVRTQAQAPLPAVLPQMPGPHGMIFPHILSLPPRKTWLSPSLLAKGDFILPLSSKSHRLLLPAATVPWPRLSAEPGA